MHLQEINLYHYFKPPKPKTMLLGWRQFWLSNLAAVIVFILIYAISLVELFYLVKKNDALEQSQISYQTQFNKIKSTYPQIFFTEDINESVANLKKEIRSQQEIVDILSKHTPFSKDLTALSSTIVKNVWLTAINITENGKRITLTGESIGMMNLQSFIKNLRDNETYEQYKINIGTIKIKDKTDPNTRINFELEAIRK